MLEQIQTTIRILILAVSGVAAVALARSPAAAPADTLLDAAAAASPSRAAAMPSAHAPHAAESDFAIFCSDRR